MKRRVTSLRPLRRAQRPAYPATSPSRRWRSVAAPLLALAISTGACFSASSVPPNTTCVTQNKEQHRLAGRTAPPQDWQATLTVSTREGVYMIFVDGRRIGATPVIRHRLAPGAHRLQIFTLAREPVGPPIRLAIPNGHEARIILASDGSIHSRRVTPLPESN